MILLLTIHVVIPSVRYFPSYPNLVLSWFAFDWYTDKGLIVFVQYALVGVPTFVFIGLPTALPFLLAALLLFRPKSRRRAHAIGYLLLALLLLTVYLNGWFFYTWPLPYKPMQTFSILLFTLLAYKNWREAIK
jgi:hypothetical protein